MAGVGVKRDEGWTVSKDYEVYEEAKQVAEGNTMKLGTTAHVKVLWGMLEAAKEELAELSHELYRQERYGVFDGKGK